MKLRVMGTAEECRSAKAFFESFGLQKEVRYVDVSEPYSNRGNSNLYRVYVDIVCADNTSFWDMLIGLMAENIALVYENEELMKLADTTTYPACADDIEW